MECLLFQKLFSLVLFVWKWTKSKINIKYMQLYFRILPNWRTWKALGNQIGLPPIDFLPQILQKGLPNSSVEKSTFACWMCKESWEIWKGLAHYSIPWGPYLSSSFASCSSCSPFLQLFRQNKENRYISDQQHTCTGVSVRACAHMWVGWCVCVDGSTFRWLCRNGSISVYATVLDGWLCVCLHPPKNTRHPLLCRPRKQWHFSACYACCCNCLHTHTHTYTCTSTHTHSHTNRTRMQHSICMHYAIVSVNIVVSWQYNVVGVCVCAVTGCASECWSVCMIVHSSKPQKTFAADFQAPASVTAVPAAPALAVC